MDDHRPASEPPITPPHSPLTTPPVRTAPPTEPGAVAATIPTWPPAIGVLAIVFGGLGLVSSAATPAMFLIMGAVGGTSSSPAMTPIGWAVWAVSLPLAAWHLVAGILTVRRRRSGPTQLVWWAVANSVAAIVGFALAGMNMTATAPTGASAPPPGMEWMTLVTVGISLAFSLIWPVFLVVFLNRPARKAHWKAW
jgi:hypothetical protein